MSLKCLIVDDEIIARKLLSDYVGRVPELELLATCNTAIEAMTFLKNEQVDILFLDIQMPEITGLDFLKILPKKPFTILTTAYSEYAVMSYELDVTDYLLKPIDFDRFYKAVLKITSKDRSSDIKNAGALIESRKAEKIFIKSDKKIIKIDAKDICCIKSQGPYVEVFTTSGERIMPLLSMSKLQEQLPGNFYRTHRSYIVNIDHIDSIEGNTIRLGNHSAVLSKNKREEFFDLIDQLNLLD